MANAKDIFNTAYDKQKLIGNNNFFNSEQEILEYNKKQEKFISSVDYSDPTNFAKFGSAEEYYKNAINFLNSEYPYDGSTITKLSWINSLNDFEHYLFNKEYPKALGYCNLSSSQYIEVFSHLKQPAENSKDAYVLGNKYIANNFFSFDNGVTFETWLKCDTQNDCEILSITALTASELEPGDLLPIQIFTLKTLSNGTTAQFVLQEGDYGTNSYSFNTIIEKNEWHHYAFTIKNNIARLFIDGKLIEQLNDINILSSNNFIFSTSGLIFENTTGLSDFESVNHSVFKLGPGSNFSLDETRLWNKQKTIEDIGRYWFTSINGNDFDDLDNCKLLFYFKFNEGWDNEYQFVCLDYSGNQNDGIIQNYAIGCRTALSAINECGFIDDTEKPEIIFKGYSNINIYSQAVKNFYDEKIQLGKDYDESNIHMLYKKFPGFILEQEDELQTKHLKQIIQILCSYFDDLYNKIGEITNYKSIQYNSDINNVYPFYDKILTSAGFDVSDLFTNLDIVEKVSSRSEITIFDEDIQKIKNSIFQNIYNNLSYILKSKGTEKSIKTFLKSYGINDNLLKINLYGDGLEYNLLDRRKQEYLKKKTVSMTGSNNIYLSSSVHEVSNMYNYSLEISTIFPNIFSSNSTSSLFGIQNNVDSNEYSIVDANYGYSVLLLKEDNKYRIQLYDYINNVSANTALIEEAYDNSVWNICIRKKAQLDKVYGDITPSLYKMELYAVNKAYESIREYSCSLNHSNTINNNGYIRYYLGSKKTNFTEATEYETGIKILYCNFWTDYLSNDTIKNHNMDVLNYGADE